MTTAYPLAWPVGWPRTPATARQPGAQFRTTLHAAVGHVQNEVRLIGGKITAISTNYTLGVEEPPDPGAAVYFVRSGRPLCIPCDRWATIKANLRAIALTCEALRGIERWGAKHTLDAMFRGFAALPPAADHVPWWTTLGVAADAGLDAIEAAYRTKAKQAHPDAGGSTEAMAQLNAAIAEARQGLKS